MMILIIVSCGNSKKDETKVEPKTDNLSKENNTSDKTIAGSAYFTNLTEKGESAPQIANIFLDAKTDYKAASLELQPTLEDCKAFYKDEAVAKKAFDFYSKESGQESSIIKPGAGQKESIVAFATTEDLQKKVWKAKVKEIFPAGYADAAPFLNPGIKVFVIKFVDQNKTSGIVYDGFAYVNSHWKVFPKPWNFIK